MKLPVIGNMEWLLEISSLRTILNIYINSSQYFSRSTYVEEKAVKPHDYMRKDWCQYVQCFDQILDSLQQHSPIQTKHVEYLCLPFLVTALLKDGRKMADYWRHNGSSSVSLNIHGAFEDGQLVEKKNMRLLPC